RKTSGIRPSRGDGRTLSGSVSIPERASPPPRRCPGGIRLDGQRLLFWSLWDRHGCPRSRSGSPSFAGARVLCLPLLGHGTLEQLAQVLGLGWPPFRPPPRDWLQLPTQ